jgi:peptide/nickel transport system permease protein
MAPWLSVAPGLAIFATVLAVNFVGDGVQDALDPRRR